jgi:quercetin dioxygenase-like cupin family protein
MAARDPALQRFLDLTEQAIVVKAPVASTISRAATKIFGALREHCEAGWVLEHDSAPVLAQLPGALALSSTTATAPLAAAFAVIEPRLQWYRRESPDQADLEFQIGHANACVIGARGIERRDDVLIGVTLMAPHIRYPDHDHPPEEIYVSLAGGAWWNAAMDWTAPGVGGLIYNPPGIRHAMRADEEPLLAIWCLWAGN